MQRQVAGCDRVCQADTNYWHQMEAGLPHRANAAWSDNARVDVDEWLVEVLHKPDLWKANLCNSGLLGKTADRRAVIGQWFFFWNFFWYWHTAGVVMRPGLLIGGCFWIGFWV